MASCNAVVDSEGDVRYNRVAHYERFFFLEVRNVCGDIVEVFLRRFFKTYLVGNENVLEVMRDSRKGKPSALNGFKSVCYHKTSFAPPFHLIEKRRRFRHKNGRSGKIIFICFIEFLDIERNVFNLSVFLESSDDDVVAG